MFRPGQIVKLKNNDNSPMFTVTQPSSNSNIGVGCSVVFEKNLLTCVIPDVMLEIVPNGGYKMKDTKFLVTLSMPEDMPFGNLADIVRNILTGGFLSMRSDPRLQYTTVVKVE